YSGRRKTVSLLSVFKAFQLTDRDVAGCRRHVRSGVEGRLNWAAALAASRYSRLGAQHAFAAASRLRPHPAPPCWSRALCNLAAAIACHAAALLSVSAFVAALILHSVRSLVAKANVYGGGVDVSD